MNCQVVTSEAEKSNETHLWFKLIKNQVKKNYLCNIFNKKVNLDIQGIEELKIDSITEEQVSNLSKYSVDLLSSYLYKDNQYIYFDTEALKDLKEIYQNFYSGLLKSQNQQGTIKIHHNNIRNFLARTNPFLEIINSNDEKNVKTFLCSEYSSGFQLNLFNVRIQDIIEPVLDIGCGEHANLVNYLNNLGVIALGIDRKTTKQSYAIECDWFDFNFGERKYGTIFSNNAFSIHFINALNKNQNVPIYNRLFFNILNSLKAGGSFYYAPSIPFIEKYINGEEYTVSHQRVHDNLYTTKILKP